MLAWVIESYLNSLVCLVGLISGIIYKATWNCIIALLDLINRKTSSMQCTLSTRKNWFARIKWMNGKKSEAIIRRCSAKNVFLRISKNHRKTPEAFNFKKETLVLVFSCELAKFLWTTLQVAASVKYGYAVNARFTHGDRHDSLEDCLLQLLFTYFG